MSYRKENILTNQRPAIVLFNDTCSSAKVAFQSFFISLQCVSFCGIEFNPKITPREND